MKYFFFGGFVLVLFAHSAVAQNERTTISPQPQGQQGWVQVNSGAPGLIRGLSFPSVDTAYAIGEAGVLRSIDGGDSWQLLPTAPVGGMQSYITAGAFRTALDGFLLRGDTVFHTLDAGITWTAAVVAGSAGAGFLYTLSRDTAFLGGVIWTKDAGKSWSDLATMPSVSPRAMAFADSRNGIVVGGLAFGPQSHQFGAGCATTSDGGASWEQQYTGVQAEFGLWGVSFVDTKILIAVGGQQYVTRSTDAGLRWDSIPILDMPPLEQLNGVQSKGGNTIGVGDAGMIYGSKDSGLTWQRQTSGVTSGMLTVSMFDDALVLAGGEQGTILKTTNGGVDWVQVFPPSPQQLSIGIYPEPETPTMDIFYDLPQLQDVTITVYDMLGKIVAHLRDSKLQTAGRHSVQIRGGSLPAGSYIVRIQSERFSGTGKFEIVK